MAELAGARGGRRGGLDHLAPSCRGSSSPRTSPCPRTSWIRPLPPRTAHRGRDEPRYPEHVPPPDRAEFVADLLRVTGRRLVLCCPLGTPSTRKPSGKSRTRYRRLPAKTTLGSSSTCQRPADPPELEAWLAWATEPSDRWALHYHGDFRVVTIEQFKRDLWPEPPTHAQGRHGTLPPRGSRTGPTPAPRRRAPLHEPRLRCGRPRALGLPNHPIIRAWQHFRPRGASP